MEEYPQKPVPAAEDGFRPSARGSSRLAAWWHPCRVVVVVLVLAATMAALPAFGGGETDEGNPKNGFGAVVSQKASGSHDVGEHSSSQEEPRQGVGNVARNDGSPGDPPGDHGGFVGELDNQVGADPDNVTNASGDPGCSS
jgi:hypothetical protein